MTSPALPDGIDLSLDPALPITAHAAEIARLIATQPVVVVAGETGSGKTTQLPKLCLGMGRRAIGHTQPRRLAARSVAGRIAQELGTSLGEVVGYQVRFTKQASADTRLKLMTDGILLAEIAHDRLLRRYDTIIIDEAHERSLNIDFLLGYLKQLLPRRPDLRVIITSATIDTARFAAHFDDAPVVEVSGRGYPVELRYRPPAGDEVEQCDAIAAAIRELRQEVAGDILVFLAGEREIRDTADCLAGAEFAGLDVLPLYARLSLDDQQRIFAPHSGQRVVLATNVAETSLTVPGIRYVVDPGWARISRYSPRTKVQRLPIEAISQASANQRAGRCGRLAPGVCIRLYSEEDYASRPAFTEPEILRTNLASVILQMAAARLGDIAQFPFVEPPDRSQIGDGLRVLEELGALKPAPARAPQRATGGGSAPGTDQVPATGPKSTQEVYLSRIGRQLARLPIDPRLGRILIEGARLGCLKQCQILVAALSIPDVRERPAEHRQAADALHARFASGIWRGGDGGNTSPPNLAAPSGRTSPPDIAVPGLRAGAAPDSEASTAPSTTVSSSTLSPVETPLRHTVHTNTRAQRSIPKVAAGGDLGALLRLWDYLTSQRRQLSSNQFRQLCRREYLHYLRIREWQDLVGQLKQLCQELDLPADRHRDDHRFRDSGKLDRREEAGRQERQLGRHSRRSTTDAMDDVVTAALAGLLSHIGSAEKMLAAPPRGRRPLQEYLGTRGTRFAISPASALAKQAPELVVAVELVETSRVWAHQVAAITPAQVEAVGGHLLKYSYSEPFFSTSSGQVLAHQKTSLLGVIIQADARVDYARIDPVDARRHFIQAALVENLWEPQRGTPYRAVYDHNQAIRHQVAELEERQRRHDLMVDDYQLFDFFDCRLGDGVFSATSLDDWLRRGKDRAGLISFALADLLHPRAETADTADWPGQWTFGDQSLPVDYVFSPGDQADGVTVKVPIALMAALDPAPFSWQVPGLRHELATELIRRLPKATRVNFVPAPDWARRGLDWLEDHDADQSQPFSAELGRALQALTGIGIDASAWQVDALPDHLRINFQVQGDRPAKKDRGQGDRRGGPAADKAGPPPRIKSGDGIKCRDGIRRGDGQAASGEARSKDLGQLQQALGAQVQASLTAASGRPLQEGQDWVFGHLAPEISLQRHQITATGYPALEDRGASVGELVAASRLEAERLHRRGVYRLLFFQLPDPTRWCVAYLSNADKLALGASPYPDATALIADARLKTIDRLTNRLVDPWSIRDQAGFRQLYEQVRPDQADELSRIVQLAANSLRLQGEVVAKLGGLSAASRARQEIEAQLADLIFAGFISRTPDPWYDRLPQYLKAMLVRLDSARGNPIRDDQRQDELDEVLDAHAAWQQAHPQDEATDTQLAFLIEELRISLFAQQLGTREKVSTRRLLNLIAAAD